MRKKSSTVAGWITPGEIQHHIHLSIDERQIVPNITKVAKSCFRYIFVSILLQPVCRLLALLRNKQSALLFTTPSYLPRTLHQYGRFACVGEDMYLR